MADWTTLGVGFLTAAAALGGGIGSQLLQTRATAHRAGAEQRLRAWESRRDAYLELLVQIAQVDAASSGALVSGLPRDGASSAASFVQALVAAEFYASPQAWSGMEPLARAAQLRANATAGPVPAPLREEIRAKLAELGATDPAGWDRLRDAYVAAAREDLSTAL